MINRSDWCRRIGVAVAVAVLGMSAGSPVLGQNTSIADASPVQNAVQLVDMWLQYQLENHEIPSISVGVVYDQETVWAKSYGFADVRNQVPATADTLYSVCSIAKLFTATAILQLRDKGQLHMDQEVRELLPWFNIRRTYPLSGPITVGSLLSHSSGLPGDLAGPYWTEQSFPTRQEFRRMIGETDTLYPASKYEEYSNVGYEVAGFIIEQRSGQSYQDYIQQEILDPLEMTSTTIDLPIDLEGSGLAVAYSGGGRSNQRDVIMPYRLEGLTAAAGLASTVNDLAKFIKWQFRLLDSGDTEILKRSTLEEMHTVQWYSPGSPTQTGYGYSVIDLDGTTLVGKDGGCPGFLSLVMMDPATKVGGVVLVNANGINVINLLQSVLTTVGPAIGMSAATSAGTPDEPGELDMYEGVYRGYPSDIEVGVVVQDEGLAWAYLQSDRLSEDLTKLRPVGEHMFERLRQDGGVAGQVEFEVDSNGRAIRILQPGSALERIL